MMVRDNRFAQTCTQTHTHRNTHLSHSEEIPSWAESSNIRHTRSHFVRTAEGLSQRDLRWRTYTKNIKGQRNALKYTLLQYPDVQPVAPQLHSLQSPKVMWVLFKEYTHLQMSSTSDMFFGMHNLQNIFFSDVFCTLILWMQESELCSHSFKAEHPHASRSHSCQCWTSSINNQWSAALNVHHFTF